MLVRLILFAVLVAALFAPVSVAQNATPPVDMGVTQLHTFECKFPDCTMVGGEALMTLVGSNRAMGARIKELEAELAKLKQSCVAKIEVVPDGTKKRS